MPRLFGAIALSNYLGTLAQLVEQLAFNQLVISSNLIRPTKHTTPLSLEWRFLLGRI